MIKPLNVSLKPCPFCGSIDIDIYSRDSIIDDNGVWKLTCSSCPAEMTSAYLLGNYSKGDKPQMLTELVNNWNRRKHEVYRKHSKGSRISKETGPPKSSL